MKSAGISARPSQESAGTLLRAESLYCERDDRVLFSDLNFSVGTSDLLQVKGSNGSGKTTLLRILCGLNSSYEGALYWEGLPVEDNRELFLSSLLYIGHRNAVNKILSPRENLRWRCALHTHVEDAAIEQALAQVSLAGYEDSPCHNLSAGQQQRVSLASLLISPARLWVLDEPFTTLDVKGVAVLESLLAGHVSTGGSVIVTTHHPLKVPCELRQLDLDALKAMRGGGHAGR
jgi:heme exporter protein A